VKKEDFIKQLRSDPLYQSALKSAKTDAERKHVIEVTEGFVEQFAAVLGPLIEKVEKDPAFAEQLRRSIATGEEIVSDVDPDVSGSQG
jgi:hypothetical protein